MNFHNKLTRLTENMNKAKLSRRAGLCETAISVYLRNEKTVPKAHVAARIAKALGVSVDWMLDDSKNWPPVRVESAEAVAA